MFCQVFFGRFLGIGKNDEFVENRKTADSVTPVKMGIQSLHDHVWAKGAPRTDSTGDFLRDHRSGAIKNRRARSLPVCLVWNGGDISWVQVFLTPGPCTLPYGFCSFAALTTCFSSTRVVTVPTPPGTGVMAPATSLTASVFTSPTNLSPSGLMPTSMTVAPGLM